MKGMLVGMLRRFLYNRWFYAFLALVCALDVVAEVLDVFGPTVSYYLNMASLVFSAVAAILAGAVFLDLHLRRGKL